MECPKRFGETASVTEFNLNSIYSDYCSVSLGRIAISSAMTLSCFGSTESLPEQSCRLQLPVHWNCRGAAGALSTLYLLYPAVQMQSFFSTYCYRYQVEGTYRLSTHLVDPHVAPPFASVPGQLEATEHDVITVDTSEGAALEVSHCGQTWAEKESSNARFSMSLPLGVQPRPCGPDQKPPCFQGGSTAICSLLLLCLTSNSKSNFFLPFSWARLTDFTPQLSEILNPQGTSH
eukprot:372171-Amphidinium_carterae.1